MDAKFSVYIQDIFLARDACRNHTLFIPSRRGSSPLVLLSQEPVGRVNRRRRRR